MKQANFLKTMALGFSMALVSMPGMAQKMESSLRFNPDPVAEKTLDKDVKKDIDRTLKENGINAEYKGVHKLKRTSFYEVLGGDVALYEIKGDGVTTKIGFAFNSKYGDPNILEKDESLGTIVEIMKHDESGVGAEAFYESVSSSNAWSRDKKTKGQIDFVREETHISYKNNTNRVTRDIEGYTGSYRKHIFDNIKDIGENSEKFDESINHRIEVKNLPARANISSLKK